MQQKRSLDCILDCTSKIEFVDICWQLGIGVVLSK